MRTAVRLILLGIIPIVVDAAGRPDWAFPVADKVQPPLKDNDQPKTVAGSTKSYTQAQIDDLKSPPDWFPDTHPAMPEVIGHGTATFACGSCHLPTGTSHDESAYVADLPASYIVRQMADFKSGARKGFGIMAEIAQALSDADVQSAAEYFSSLPVRPWLRLVETGTVPKTYINPSNAVGNSRRPRSEPIGSRIVELPEDEIAAIARDPRSGFVAYTPKGSIAKSRALVTSGGSETIPCTICHGPALKSVGTTPGIAGRHAGYVVRQLYLFQNGGRSGPQEALMHNVLQRVTDDDMLAIAACVASLQP